MTPGRVVVMSALVLNFVVIGYGAYLAFWPMKSIDIVQPDVILNPNKQVMVGDVLAYQIRYCKYTNKQASIERTLVGKSVTYSLPTSANNVPTGCKTAISRNTIVPLGIQPGVYKLELSATYSLNPLRTVTVSHYTESFTVLPRSADAPQIVVETVPSTSPSPFGTDPLTQEPTHPTPSPSAEPTPKPNLLQRLLNAL